MTTNETRKVFVYFDSTDFAAVPIENVISVGLTKHGYEDLLVVSTADREEGLSKVYTFKLSEIRYYIDSTKATP